MAISVAEAVEGIEVGEESSKEAGEPAIEAVVEAEVAAVAIFVAAEVEEEIGDLEDAVVDVADLEKMAFQVLPFYLLSF